MCLIHYFPLMHFFPRNIVFLIHRRSVEDLLPRTIENVRIRASIQATINQVSALVGAVRRPRKPKRKSTKRKTKKKPHTTAAKKSQTGKRKSATKKRKRKTGGKRKKAKKAKKGQPKRALSAFFIWMNSNRQKIKEEHPGLSLADFGRKAGELWKDLKERTVIV